MCFQRRQHLLLIRMQMVFRKSAFTFIEILLVVVIIGVIAAVSMPLYFSFLDDSQDVRRESDIRNLGMALEAAFYGREITSFVAADVSSLETIVTNSNNLNFDQISQNGDYAYFVNQTGTQFLLVTCSEISDEVIWYGYSRPQNDIMPICTDQTLSYTLGNYSLLEF